MKWYLFLLVFLSSCFEQTSVEVLENGNDDSALTTNTSRSGESSIEIGECIQMESFYRSGNSKSSGVVSEAILENFLADGSIQAKKSYLLETEDHGMIELPKDLVISGIRGRKVMVKLDDEENLKLLPLCSSRDIIGNKLATQTSIPKIESKITRLDNQGRMVLKLGYFYDRDIRLSKQAFRKTQELIDYFEFVGRGKISISVEKYRVSREAGRPYSRVIVDYIEQNNLDLTHVLDFETSLGFGGAYYGNTNNKFGLEWIVISTANNHTVGHEIGHSLGIDHSAKGGTNYADDSTIMGGSHLTSYMTHFHARDMSELHQHSATKRMGETGKVFLKSLEGSHNVNGAYEAAQVASSLPRDFYIGFRDRENGLDFSSKGNTNAVQIHYAGNYKNQCDDPPNCLYIDSTLVGELSEGENKTIDGIRFHFVSQKNGLAEVDIYLNPNDQAPAPQAYPEDFDDGSMNPVNQPGTPSAPKNCEVRTYSSPTLSNVISVPHGQFATAYTMGEMVLRACPNGQVGDELWRLYEANTYSCNDGQLSRVNNDKKESRFSSSCQSPAPTTTSSAPSGPPKNFDQIVKERGVLRLVDVYNTKGYWFQNSNGINGVGSESKAYARSRRLKEFVVASTFGLIDVDIQTVFLPRKSDSKESRDTIYVNEVKDYIEANNIPYDYVLVNELDGERDLGRGLGVRRGRGGKGTTVRFSVDYVANDYVSLHEMYHGFSLGHANTYSDEDGYGEYKGKDSLMAAQVKYLNAIQMEWMNIPMQTKTITQSSRVYLRALEESPLQNLDSDQVIKVKDYYISRRKTGIKYAVKSFGDDPIHISFPFGRTTALYGELEREGNEFINSEQDVKVIHQGFEDGFAVIDIIVDGDNNIDLGSVPQEDPSTNNPPATEEPEEPEVSLASCRYNDYTSYTEFLPKVIASGQKGRRRFRGQFEQHSCREGYTGKIDSRYYHDQQVECFDGSLKVISKIDKRDILSHTCVQVEVPEVKTCTYFNYTGLAKTAYSVHKMEAGQTITRALQGTKVILPCPSLQIGEKIVREYQMQTIGCNGDSFHVGDGAFEISRGNLIRETVNNTCRFP